jgi:predicted transcriptional regulator
MINEKSKLMQKLHRFLFENEVVKQDFARKIGLSRDRFYQILCGFRKIPEKSWFRLIKLTEGEITLADLEREYRDNVHFIVSEGDDPLECKIKIKRDF